MNQHTNLHRNLTQDYQIENIKIDKQQLKMTGVCGICKSEYSSYKKAVNCCFHLKGEDYAERINQVFKM